MSLRDTLKQFGMVKVRNFKMISDNVMRTQYIF